jgi:hypothetical protein
VQTKEDIRPPEDLFNPPGLLKDMFNYCEEIAQVSQPELSLVAALIIS